MVWIPLGLQMIAPSQAYRHLTADLPLLRRVPLGLWLEFTIAAPAPFRAPSLSHGFPPGLAKLSSINVLIALVSTSSTSTSHSFSSSSQVAFLTCNRGFCTLTSCSLATVSTNSGSSISIHSWSTRVPEYLSTIVFFFCVVIFIDVGVVLLH
ncbi:uncharacterized protein CC84DRAFT_655461 [Paraphaeosphaeria sporulosa]|uniref:Uncharacterized protein n=1 Tax=Paraphaeosphaeria sporulosa TaxID=1460663 RepID=A0A177CKI2_9PLEO|nr:uncharacterized protein CC84DRAFT_655461 [Paraphaeosphaeria sporulosa]OAG07350.1 hypothetical protein CC84DRAFT_655461 [Paraphaeosphaeria sporulosa]